MATVSIETRKLGITLLKRSPVRLASLPTVEIPLTFDPRVFGSLHNYDPLYCWHCTTAWPDSVVDHKQVPPP